jgi:two-component system chemotaxis response regulator CheY
MYQSNQGGAGSRPGFSKPPVFKILLVDDTISIRLHVRKILAKSNVSLIEAANGLEALQQCQANRDLKLIVCDVNMPGMDGMTFLEELKKSWPANTPKPSIVMLTTENHPDFIKRGQLLGVSGWMTKPPPEQALLKLVERLKESAT